VAPLDDDDDDDDDDGDDDNDVDHLLLLDILGGEHEDACRRRAIRMTKTEEAVDMSGGEVRSGS